MKNAEQVFPIYKVEHDTLLSMQGDLTIAFELTLPELFTLSNDEYMAFHQTWVKAIKLLPKNSIFHKQDWFVQSSYQANFGDKTFLGHASERFFNERPYLAHHCLVMLTKRPENYKPVTSAASSLMRKHITPKQTTSTELFRDFADCAGQFKRLMEDSGLVRLRRLSDDELAGTIAVPGILEQYCFLLSRTDQPVLKDIHLQDELRIGEQSCYLYTLAEAEHLPALVGPRITYDQYSTDKTKFSTGFASPIGALLNCNHIYNQYLFIEDSAKTLKKLEAKKLRLQSLSAYSRENAIGRDATQEFLNEAISQQRLPVKAHFNILSWTDNKAELKDVRNKVSSSLAQLDAQPKQETDGAPQIWWAGLPGNAGNFPMNDTFDTFAEQAACFFNLETNYRSSLSPCGVRFGDRLSGKPIHVDLSDEPMKLGITTNRNKFIIGPSGSGKSFCTNHVLRSYYEQGAHIVVVDVGHSYEGLCEFVDGYYFTYSEESPISFNPFYVGKDDVLDTEKRESIKAMILALWKKEDEGVQRSEYIAISDALFHYYESQPEFACFNSFYEFLKGPFYDTMKASKVKDQHFDIDNLLFVLRPYYQGGEYDYLLNATENLDLLHRRFIVFELDNIKDHPILFPVVTLIIMETFVSKMRKLPKDTRKMILIEEAWKAIAREGMAEYIKYLFKTVRKYFGEALVVTQDIEDIISSPVVKQAIINNSDCKILLDQRKYQNDFPKIQQLLGITDKETALIMSMNRANDERYRYKEVFISLNGQLSRVYRTEVSREEYWTYTTESAEKAKVKAYKKKYGDIRKAIAVIVQEEQENKAA
ncbi:TraG family conjugative transposon ATPase [Mucilaginibacter boryungensis]|uniref:TraG family conjugative transposon ATPase n=1 Tax=Mucilaginibacter boryungensis TaxID=768480 RepID=A0ABR9XDD9_9SPHI|nr:TraG family conjugative transposon ATPase [Mucilaginibacter boryungensis]MBE9665412.1 TraG family conjugative transposon ATPase [Mucilaginibacter boryungensis]